MGNLPRWRGFGEGMDLNDDAGLIERLATESKVFDPSGADQERRCWMILHRHVHGMLPSEYDVRDVPEELYLAVLAARRSLDN